VLLPVELVLDDVRLVGETLDVSEGGLRCVVRPASGPGGPGSWRPELGAALQVRVTLDESQPPLQADAAVRRVGTRHEQHVELSVAFVDLPERAADRVRARVFTQLRLLRARGLA
jgi:hypothetical protein